MDKIKELEIRIDNYGRVIRRGKKPAESPQEIATNFGIAILQEAHKKVLSWFPPHGRSKRSKDIESINIAFREMKEE